MFNFLNKKILISGVLGVGILFSAGVSKINANPDVIYGTWLLKKDDTYKCVVNAIKSGARIIDTARSYHNEEAVGKAIRSCIDEKIINTRDEIKVITKILPCDIEKEYSITGSLDIAVENLFNKSFEKLSLGYIDAVLLHDSYTEEFDISEIWKALNRLKNSYPDKIKKIGVSNFGIYNLQNLIPAPEVIQNPVFPGLLSQDGMDLFGLPDKQSYEWARQSEHKKIEYQGYKALGHGMLKDNEIINKIAKKYDCSWAEVCLKYALQRDISPVFSSENIDHIKSVYENISKFELKFEELDKLDRCIELEQIFSILYSGQTN